MAQREFSCTLKSLNRPQRSKFSLYAFVFFLSRWAETLDLASCGFQFMERAKAEEERKVVEEQVVVQEDNAFGSSASIKRKCIVIMEGNPHPGAVKGRMSFQSFNPYIDKLNQGALESCMPQSYTSVPDDQNNTISDRLENYHAMSPKNNSYMALKRKQPEMDQGVQSPHNSEYDGQSSQEKKRTYNRKPKLESLD